ncbi:MAG TPA: heavy-metal-associated domain-containing protein [Gemmatimonas sp.]|nr:heavy-metal-associated domain-containing protein [Gemmatimonas sp.]
MSPTTLAGSTATASHCVTTSATAQTDPAAAPQTIDGSQRLDLTIADMTCGHCINAVRDALKSLPGVTVEHVRMGKASVTLTPQGASPAALIEAIRDAGYRAAFGDSTAADSKAELPQVTTGGSCCSSR